MTDTDKQVTNSAITPAFLDILKFYNGSLNKTTGGSANESFNDFDKILKDIPVDGQGKCRENSFSSDSIWIIIFLMFLITSNIWGNSPESFLDKATLSNLEKELAYLHGKVDVLEKINS